jgi:hypothetical protein
MPDIPDIKCQMVKVIRSERMKLVAYVAGTGEVRVFIQNISWQITKGRHHMGDLCINERVVSKWIINN